MAVDDPDATSGADELFEMSLDNLCVAGLDGYFKRLNPSWTRTLGWTIEELMGRPSVEFVHPDDRAATLAGREQLRVGESMAPLVNRYLCKDGSYRWLEWRSVAHVERGLVYASARDITDARLAAERLEQLQRQLLFADRMASVGTLAAGTAHEINNPLSYVLGNLTLIREHLAQLATGGPAASAGLAEVVASLIEMTDDAAQGAERIGEIIRGLKTFARAEDERRAVLDVRRVLALAVDLTTHAIRHHARLVTDFQPTPPVEADESRLGQVFINLLVNAAQALPDGDAEAHEIRITTATDADGRAVIEVADTGAGIPAAIIGRIFDPFFTTKPVGIGTGLGLSICHNVVTGLGGELTVASDEGRGTTFRVVLPPVATRPRAEPPSPSSAAAAAGAVVLVVDDDPAVGVLLRRILQTHDVTVVTEARTALELLDAGHRFDVILSDVMMPEMSGMEFFDELTRRFPDLVPRVVFISGGAFTPSARAFLDTVANPLLEKPFDVQRMRATVQQLAGR